MKNVVRFLAVVVILVSIVGIVGCSSGSTPVGSARDRAVSMMKVLPSDVISLSFFDIYALRTDTNLSSAWASMKSYLEDYYLGNDTNYDKINSVSIAYTNVSDIGFFEGDFTLSQLMEWVGVADNGSYNYGGFAVHTSSANASVVMINSSAIAGSDSDVRQCIDVVSGNETSLYGNGDIEAIFDRVPSGYAFGLGIATNETATGNFSGLLAWGASLNISGGNDVETYIYKFNGSDTAQQYMVIMGNVSDDGTMHYVRTQDGAFVKEFITPVTATPTPTPTVALTPEPTATPVATVTPTPAP